MNEENMNAAWPVRVLAGRWTAQGPMRAGKSVRGGEKFSAAGA